jgi:phospholipid/cholesterol/gamma-HCH transport system substrate-binding protein
MLTRFVRAQLIIFTVASVIGLAVMVFGYMQVPTLLGIGHITVKVELPRSGGLYRFSNVTYRGVQVGKVTDIKVYQARRVEATVSLNSSPKVPTDLDAAVLSVSAVGEQYIDLQPRSPSAPYLADGAVIPVDRVSMPQQVGPMLDQLSALVDSIPKDRLGNLLDESFTAFNGAGFDIGSLLDSSSKLTHDLSGIAGPSRRLVDDAGPLLDSQVQSADALRTWAHSLAGVSDQIATNDPQVRTILQQGPGFSDELSRLLTAVKPTLPVLLANLTSVGQIAVTYHPSIEQLLVLLPPNVASTQAAQHTRNPTGLPLGDFTLSVGDPPACTVGFLPPSMWRSPEDDTDIDTPDGLYCKLPQDSPISVRGARNYPCMEKPGKRAPTVQICDSDEPFAPLAMRQHTLGPMPLDPNLIAQGIPPDDRVTADDNIHAPIEGTPMPPLNPGSTPAPPPLPEIGVQSPPEAPAGTAAPQQEQSPSPLPTAPAGDAAMGIPNAAPNGFSANDSDAQPSVATVTYDPSSGAYMSPDGHMYQQADLTASAVPKSWKDLVLTQ